MKSYTIQIEFISKEYFINFVLDNLPDKEDIRYRYVFSKFPNSDQLINVLILTELDNEEATVLQLKYERIILTQVDRLVEYNNSHYNVFDPKSKHAL